jgi:hypothetical protein
MHPWASSSIASTPSLSLLPSLIPDDVPCWDAEEDEWGAKLWPMGHRTGGKDNGKGSPCNWRMSSPRHLVEKIPHNRFRHEALIQVAIATLFPLRAFHPRGYSTIYSSSTCLSYCRPGSDAVFVRVGSVWDLWTLRHAENIL